MKLATLVAPIVLLASHCALAHNCNAPAHDILTAVVHISTADGVTASGVVVGEGKILTAAHAVGDEQDMFVRRANGELRHAAVTAVDTHNDLALLSTDTSGLLPVRISTRSLKLDEQVWAVGFPANRGQRSTHGRFQKVKGERLHTTASIESGNSGGGLLHCHEGQHELAGVVHGYVAKYGANGLVNTGRSVVIPIAQVVAFLDSICPITGTMRQASDADVDGVVPVDAVAPARAS